MGNSLPQAVQNMILQYHQTHSTQEITDLIKSKGYDIHWGTVKKYVHNLKSNNTFVSDLAKYSYSDFIEARISNCLIASNKLKEILQSAKSQNTQIAAAKTLHRCEIDLATLVSSDILKISATNWAHYVRDLEAQISTLKNKENNLKLA